MVRGRGAGRRSPEESVRLLAQLRKAFPQLGMAEAGQFQVPTWRLRVQEMASVML